MIAKLVSDYHRLPLMQEDLNIDGPGMPARKPNNYKEIARAVGLPIRPAKAG